MIVYFVKDRFMRVKLFREMNATRGAETRGAETREEEETIVRLQTDSSVSKEYDPRMPIKSVKNLRILSTDGRENNHCLIFGRLSDEESKKTNKYNLYFSNHFCVLTAFALGYISIDAKVKYTNNETVNEVSLL